MIFGLVLTLCLPLAGCIKTGKFVIERPDAEIVEVGIPRCADEPTQRLSVDRLEKGYSVPIWSIERVGQEDLDRQKFTLGAVPAGFREVTPYDPGLLESGVKVSVEVEPTTGSLGVIEWSEVPADGNPYLITTGGDPKPIGDLEVYLSRSAETCQATKTQRQRVSIAVLVALVVLCFGCGLAFLRWQRRRRMAP